MILFEINWQHLTRECQIDIINKMVRAWIELNCEVIANEQEIFEHFEELILISSSPIAVIDIEEIIE